MLIKLLLSAEKMTRSYISLTNCLALAFFYVCIPCSFKSLFFEGTSFEKVLAQ